MEGAQKVAKERGRVRDWETPPAATAKPHARPDPLQPVPAPPVPVHQNLQGVKKIYYVCPHGHIDAMIETDPVIATSTIWQRLADDHGGTIAYPTLRTYVTSRRATRESADPA
jgi:hypothetical protein